MALLKLDQFLQTLNHVLNVLPAPPPSSEQLKQVRLVAHRGACSPNVLENTHAAFKPCLENQIWGIEFDLRWTRDDEPIVSHDSSLKRVFNQDMEITNITRLGLEKLQPLVPSLEEMVSFYGHKNHLFIELKTPPSPKQNQRLLELLKPLTPTQDYHLLSFDLDCFSLLKKQLPSSCFVAIGRTQLASLIQKIEGQGLGGMTGHFLMMTQNLRQICREQGLNIGTGFPDKKHLFYREASKPVDWIFTNRALELNRLLKGHPSIGSEKSFRANKDIDSQH